MTLEAFLARVADVPRTRLTWCEEDTHPAVIALDAKLRAGRDGRWNDQHRGAKIHIEIGAIERILADAGQTGAARAAGDHREIGARIEGIDMTLSGRVRGKSAKRIVWTLNVANGQEQAQASSQAASGQMRMTRNKGGRIDIACDCGRLQAFNAFLEDMAQLLAGRVGHDPKGFAWELRVEAETATSLARGVLDKRFWIDARIGFPGIDFTLQKAQGGDPANAIALQYAVVALQPVFAKGEGRGPSHGVGNDCTFARRKVATTPTSATLAANDTLKRKAAAARARAYLASIGAPQAIMENVRP